MQYYWLNRGNNKNLIIFFCGWSFDYKPFERLDFDGYDLVCLFDYRDIILPDFTEVFDNYDSISLVAWSMGVYVAYILKDFLPNFDNKIAVNGTPYPIDDEYGIPVKTFDLTLKYVDTGLGGKFQKNLFKRPEDYQKYLENPVARTVENQKAELVALNNFIKSRKISYEKFYDSAIISDTDKIIPTRNQKKCWEKHDTPFILMDSGHFPFFEFDSWKDIICKQTPEQ